MRNLWASFSIKLIGAMCLFFALIGCAGNKPAGEVEPSTKVSEASNSPAVRDSLRAKFVLTIADEDGKFQDLDAVLFSVPGKRYRMELTGPMGIGVASLLWQTDGWNIVFPTEKRYLSGNGYMVGLLGDTTVPMVPIHQVADLFDGILYPQGATVIEETDSAGVQIVRGKAPSGIPFTYGTLDGHVVWFAQGGTNGRRDVLRFSDYRTFENVETPENIIFERNGKMFLKIRIKKVTRGKSFSSGTWRLNIPRSYERIGG